MSKLCQRPLCRQDWRGNKSVDAVLVLSEQVKDICKAVDKDIQINNIRLLYKTGVTGSINSGIV